MTCASDSRKLSVLSSRVIAACRLQPELAEDLAVSRLIKVICSLFAKHGMTMIWVISAETLANSSSRTSQRGRSLSNSVRRRTESPAPHPSGFAAVADQEALVQEPRCHARAEAHAGDSPCRSALDDEALANWVYSLHLELIVGLQGDATHRAAASRSGDRFGIVEVVLVRFYGRLDELCPDDAHHVPCVGEPRPQNCAHIWIRTSVW